MITPLDLGSKLVSFFQDCASIQPFEKLCTRCLEYCAFICHECCIYDYASDSVIASSSNVLREQVSQKTQEELISIALVEPSRTNDEFKGFLIHSPKPPDACPFGVLFASFSENENNAAYLFLSSIAEALCLVYQRNAYSALLSEEYMRQLLMNELLTGNATNIKATTSAQLLGFHLNTSHRICCIDLTPLHHENRLLLQQSIQRSFSGSCWMQQLQQEMFICIVEEQEQQKELFDDLYLQFLPIQLSIGVSDPCPITGDYAQALDQAKQALRWSKGEITYYHSIAIYSFLGGQVPSSFVYPFKQQLTFLTTQRNGVELLNTLEAFVASRRRDEVAKRLHLSPLGLDKRLQKIRKFFPEMDDPSLTFELLLGIRMHRHTPSP